MKLYPLKFEPIYKKKIWGGNRLADVFSRDLSENNIGESWEVSTNSGGVNKVKNGPLAGINLFDLFKKYPEQITGKNIEEFPLLIKFLDANQNLSVQVHPDDQYARANDEGYGKTEMWYILEAEPDAELILGLKPCTTRDILESALESQKLEPLLNRIKVRKGDVFYIPAGMVHSIGKGILLAEIQQNSDTTYRLYDWNRTDKEGNPRPLHINEALEIINYNRQYSSRENKLTYRNKKYKKSFLVASPHFITEKVQVNDSYSLNPENEKHFYILITLKGSGTLSFKNENLKIQAGETILLPASLSVVQLEGDMKILISYIEDSKSHLVSQMMKLGFNRSEINSIPGMESW